MINRKAKIITAFVTILCVFLYAAYPACRMYHRTPGIIADFATQYPDSDYLFFLERIREELEEG